MPLHLLQQSLKPVLLLLLLLLLTPTQTNPTHLSPERSGSDGLIRREGSVTGPAAAGEKGLKELLTHLNSHPCTRTCTAWAVTCEITAPLVRFVSEGLYQLLNVP